MTSRSKYFFGIVGILLSVVGWSVSNSDQIPMLQSIVSPEYDKALSAYTALRNKDAILNHGDEGFQELVLILKENIKVIKGSGKPLISRLKTVGWGSEIVKTDEGIQMQDYLELEISFSNAKPISGKFRRLQYRIETKYQKQSLFFWSTIIFWMGIVMSLIALLLETSTQKTRVKKRNQQPSGAAGV